MSRPSFFVSRFSPFVLFLAAAILPAPLLTAGPLTAQALAAGPPQDWPAGIALTITGCQRDGSYAGVWSDADGAYDFADANFSGAITPGVPGDFGTLDFRDAQDASGELTARVGVHPSINFFDVVWDGAPGGAFDGAALGASAVPEPAVETAIAAILLIGFLSPRRRRLAAMRVVLNEEIDRIDREAPAWRRGIEGLMSANIYAKPRPAQGGIWCCTIARHCPTRCATGPARAITATASSWR